MLRIAAVTLIGSAAFFGSAAAAERTSAPPTPNEPTKQVNLVVEAPLETCAELALADFEHALMARGLKPQRCDALRSGLSVVIGLAKESPLVARLLGASAKPLPNHAEALCIQRMPVDGTSALLIAGRDSRGLSYALLEAARAVDLSPVGSNAIDEVHETVETPFLRVRSMTIHPCNQDVEAEWYENENFWKSYFAMLARNRYNNFTLTFSDQTNYLNPIYAYLVDVPEFPQVRVRGLSAEARAQKLAMLRRIAELARKRGLEFTLGIWMQTPVPEYAGEVLVEGLPSGLQAAQYAAQGLKRVLAACPGITGIQFRMNAEAGVPEDQQREFYQPLFEAVRNCGRPISLDLRYKGLQPETTQAAIDLGLDVTVSTKFWAEHLGLPYHPTVADRNYRDSRYSFGSMLAYPRDYRVTYRLWSAGSQRLLLWGDPEYAGRFAQSCRLGGGEGFEVFAPLTNKGHGNDPGAWRIFADAADEYFAWEHDRYWFFYLVFGRLGYNPATAPEIWRRELRSRFGDAAADMESAYCQASRILPLITATRLPSASEWRWWPEMDTGGRLREYMHTQPADTAQFYAIRTWQRTPDWPWEAWDNTIPGYVEDATAGRLRGKATPAEVAHMLHEYATRTEASLEAAHSKVGAANSVEFRATQIDLRVHACLARYHAEKTRAATHLALFETTGQAGRLPEALSHMRAAAGHWRHIVRLTDGFYSDDLVFGIRQGTRRSRAGLHHSGQWKDRLPEIVADVTYLEDLVQQHRGKIEPYTALPGEAPRSPGLAIEHTPIKDANPGEDIVLTAKLKTSMPSQQLILHYRSLDQTADWRHITMSAEREGCFRATIVGAAVGTQFDLQYYFEGLQDGQAGCLWPSWEVSAPYYLIRVGPH